MNKLAILGAASLLLSAHSFAATCSYGLIEMYKKGASQYVYTAENKELLVMSSLSIEKSLKELTYIPIRDVVDCITSYKNFSAPDSCKAVFELAAAAHIQVANAEAGLDSMAGLYPADVYAYYKTYAGIPSDGSYYVDTMKRLYLVDSGRDPDWKAGGYEDFFGGLSSIAKDCRDDAGIPTHVTDNFNPNSKVGVTYLDVYHGATLSCSFAANPGNDQTVRVVVPKAYHWCVKTIAGNKPHFVARIDKVDTTTGELKTVTASGGSEEFLNNKVDGTPKIFAQEGNNTVVNAMMGALDMGIVAFSTTKIDSVPSISEINFNDIASLDVVAFKAVAICEGGVDPSNYEADLADWYLSEWFSRTSLVSAELGRDGGYYRAIYQQVIANRAVYPILAKLHDRLKKGTMSWDDLYNWNDNGYVACYMNYPLSWVDALTLDYIVDGDVDDSTLNTRNYVLIAP